MSDRLRGLYELCTGGALVTLSFWGPMLEHVMQGLHAFAVLSGAFVGGHGVWRILKGRRRSKIG